MTAPGKALIVRVIWGDPIEGRYVLETLHSVAPAVGEAVFCIAEDRRPLPTPGFVVERRSDYEFVLVTEQP